MQEKIQGLWQTLKGGDRRTWVVLLGSALLMCIFVYQGNPAFYAKHLAGITPSWAPPDAARHAYEFGASFLLFFLIPLLCVKLLLKEKLADYGLRLGDLRFGMAFVGVSALVLPLFLYLASRSPDFRAVYPLWRQAAGSAGGFGLWVFLYLFYYIGWEFFFRGFILFGLRDSTTPFIAVMMQTLPSTIIHIGKPQGETMSAVFAGIVFGMVALRTRSILYVLLVHWYVGALTHLFCGI